MKWPCESSHETVSLTKELSDHTAEILAIEGTTLPRYGHLLISTVRAGSKARSYHQVEQPSSFCTPKSSSAIAKVVDSCLIYRDVSQYSMQKWRGDCCSRYLSTKQKIRTEGDESILVTVRELPMCGSALASINLLTISSVLCSWPCTAILRVGQMLSVRCAR